MQPVDQFPEAYQSPREPGGPYADEFEPDDRGDPYDRPPARSERRRDPYDRPDPYDRLDEYDRPDPYERGSRRREESARSYQETRERREDRARTLGTVIHVAAGVIATIFVLHIVFVLFGANQGSGFVSFVYGTAKVLVFGFGDVFTPGDATIGLVLNYGLAAIVYLVVGRLLAGALRRR